MAFILLVEDDSYFAMALKIIVEDHGHRVELAENGKEAIVKLQASGPFDCIISDMQMPGMGGLQLADWVRLNQPTPFILMTGFSPEMSTKKAMDTGAVNLLFKPFKTEEVQQAIDLCLNQAGHSETGLKVDTFCAIPVHLVLGGATDINIYTKRENRYIKIISRGEAIERSALETALKAQGPPFFTERENLALLIPLELIFIKGVVAAAVPPLQKLEYLRRTGELLHSKMRLDGVDEAAYHGGIQFIECVLDILDDKKIFDLLLHLESSGDHIYNHILSVTVVSVMIATHLKWSKEDLLKIAIAGFFHDIGELSLKKEILLSPWPLLTVAQRHAFQTHPHTGCEILKRIGVISSEICDIVLQHHENDSGSGYPQGLTYERLHRAARLIQVADLFCSNLFPGPNGRGMPAKMALAKIKQFSGNGLEFIRALDELFKGDTAIKVG